MIQLSFIFFFSFTALFTLRRLAKRIGLVDIPNLRKRHDGEIPLVGGIAVFITIAQFVYNNIELMPHAHLYLMIIAILTTIGALDDKFDISYKFRLLVQASLTVTMMYFTDFQLNFVGNILGIGDLEFGFLSPLITILAVIGAINAFNMVDGIDGLLGGISIVTFLSLAFVLTLASQTELAFICVVIVVAIVPYVAFNMGWLGKKRRIFMGDAGSMMIGFTVIWLLLVSSQMKGGPIIKPVTGLWIIGLPLMDMVTVMIRRIKRKRSPFRPDRDHLHHICLQLGFGRYKSLFIICGISAIFASVGIIGEYVDFPESVMFFGFLATFAVYNYVLTAHWPHRKDDLITSS